MPIEVVLGLLLFATLLNIGADILLLWGARRRDAEIGLEAFLNTPERFVAIGAYAGLVVIPAWFLLTPWLVLLPGVFGIVGWISYSAFVSGALVTHMGFLFISVALRARPELNKDLSRIMGWLRLFTFSQAVVCSIAMALVISNTDLSARFFHFLLLPAPAIILIQLIGGSLLKSIPFVQISSGPIAMAGFFVCFIDLIRSNPDYFGRL